MLHEATIHDPHQQIRIQTPRNQRNKPHMKIARKDTEITLQEEDGHNHESLHSLGGQILY
jgi:hypothetical protein